MTLFNSLHFSHPLWLWLIPIILIIALVSQLQSQTTHGLRKLVDHKLLAHLELANSQTKLPMRLTLVSVLLCCLGLAGISWTKASTPLYESTSKTVLVVDQSLSMFSTDAKPNRQTQLKQTVRDILERSQEGDIALVAFAGEAYVISPFSQDRETITHFLLALDPLIMPVYGSQLSQGIETALKLSTDPNESLHLIVFTDDINDQDRQSIKPLLEDREVTLDVIAIGSQQGASIKLPDGRLLRRNGQAVIAGTPIDALQDFTQQLGGNFYQARLSPSQISAITQPLLPPEHLEESHTNSIQWQSQGHWFALPLLLCLALAFRKGMLLMLLVGLLSFPNDKLLASPLDWFLTPDQKGQQAVDQGDWQAAQEHFKDPKWKAASAYALEDYQQSIEALQGLNKNASEHYNLGNAFALNGNIEQAIKAYQAALELDPSLQQAKENLEYLQKQQDQQEQQSQQEQDSNSSQDSSKDSSQSDSQQNQQPSNNDQQDSNRDNQEDSSQKSDEKQDKPSGSEDNKQDEQASQPEQATNETLDKEQTQALNQWLRQIQDDPGSLLQRKLWYLHQEKRSTSQYRQEDGQNPW